VDEEEVASESFIYDGIGELRMAGYVKEAQPANNAVYIK
jgi:hypothetical protein